MALGKALSFTGELRGTEERDEHTTARVRITKASTLNDGLRQLLPSVVLHGVQEEVPRMHDIFIRVVSEHQPEVVAQGMTE